MSSCSSEPPELPRRKRVSQATALNIKKFKYNSLTGLIVQQTSTPSTVKGIVFVTQKPYSFWTTTGADCLSSMVGPNTLGLLINTPSNSDDIKEAKQYIDLLLKKKNTQYTVNVIMEPSCQEN